MNALLPIAPAQPMPMDATTGALRAGRRAPVYVRQLRDGEASVVSDHLKRLGPVALRSRFGNAVNATFIERYAARAIGPQSLVKGLFVEGALRGLAELRFLDEARESAELAFSVEPAFQSLGHGDRLFALLVAAARNRGVKRLFLTCLRENRRMQAIAARHGADLTFMSGDVTAEIRRPHADAASIAREWADESEAFAFAMIEWRRTRTAAFLAPFLRIAEAFSPTPSRP